MSIAPHRPHVLVVHSSAELYGSDKSLLDLVQARREEFEFTVALPEDGPLVPLLRAAGARVAAMDVCKVKRDMLKPAGLLAVWRSTRRSLPALQALAGDRPFDLVYSNTMAVLGGALLARRAGLPHVWHVREIVANSRLMTWGFRALALWLGTRLVCNSGQTRAWIAGPGLKKRCDVVWNGVELSVSTQGREQERRALGYGPQDLVFCFVGRLNAWKGQLLAVEAFERLQARAPGRHRLLIVGSSFAGQEHFEAELTARLAASPCRNAIQRLPFRDDIDSIWQAADVVLVPSLEPEPFGRVAIEAMAHARPVIAAAHGGLVEIVDDGRTGLLFTPRDAEALAQAMQRLSADPALRQSMGAAGRERQASLFSVAAYAERMARVFKQTLTRHNQA
ncbi:glycosyltransferase family 4 protein [Pelomonas sp. P7]|uniref:Glycosyltransferase family 4 protein n=1 Tax=Pelomonas caseinilytica TaxID=2906763 RepID=A0ABS8XID9_9BURK|nr:glycosyltransferase family 4 protein [Pelomonas sp. P7]MCE4538318.1 glycosyltransferase family 4 protein [Pelomonas sp. P7]